MHLFAERRIYSVSEITAEIKRDLEDRYGEVWVKGEISNFRHHSSGHMYFTLKDDRAQVRAACFRGNNTYLRFRPDDGLEVLVRGRVSVYEPRGEYQLIVQYMEPVGVGSLQLAFEQLKEKLRREGLFDAAHKKPLPLLPRKVGIVTSPSGAAIRDILRILDRRNASLDVLLYPASVQGAGAASEIAAGVRYFNTRSDIDVIIVGRGGGSIEDLWAFNEETLARAVFHSVLPVISAVGHEVDYTICDFVADLRAPTPSAAAETVSGAREDLRATVRSLQHRLLGGMSLGLERRRSVLDRLALNRAFNVAPNKVRELQQRFDESTVRLKQAMLGRARELRHRSETLAARLGRVDLGRTLDRRRDALALEVRALEAALRGLVRAKQSRLELAAGKLDALSPLAILERGYAICRAAGGKIIKEAASLSPGDLLDARLARGAVECRVEKVRP
ncbi:MAG: exodeoxyribonuclease VII large subunit [Acidobacteria bacterium]|nr:MAG: exodeoxyribonuclease VII large subunit [Acidobacteriota bacterium]